MKYLVLNKDVGNTELCYDELNYHNAIKNMFEYVYDENEGRRVRTSYDMQVETGINISTFYEHY